VSLVLTVTSRGWKAGSVVGRCSMDDARYWVLGIGRWEAVPWPLDSENYCGRIAGQWQDASGALRKWCEPVLQVYGFMDYQLRSPQEDLLSNGFCVFQGGE